MKSLFNHYLVLTICIVLLSFTFTFAQSYCDAVGNTEAENVLMPWKLRPESQVGNPANALRPIIQEMQRLFPQPPKGLELTYGIFSSANPVFKPNGIQYYEGYFMIKDIRCEKIKGVKQLKPEGETGNWMYFRANDFEHYLQAFAADSQFTLTSTELRLYTVSKIEIVDNPNGMKGIYFYNERDEQKFAGWYFSSTNVLPFRRINKHELELSYNEYWQKKFVYEIDRLEKVLASSQRNINEVNSGKVQMTAKEKEDYLRSIRESDQKTQEIIDRYKIQQQESLQRLNTLKNSTPNKEDAFVNFIDRFSYNPNELQSKKGKGQYVYVENLAIFNSNLPKWQPQFIVSSFRRPDASKAKTTFNTKVENEFDFNVVRKIVGLKPMPQLASISNLGSTQGGYTSGKTTNANSENSADESANGVLFNESFSDSAIGKAPNKWTVSNNSAVVINNLGKNWLAMKDTGLFFPDYSTLLLPKDFTLEFDVSWNKGISYYSPNFIFHLGAARYDNTLKKYDRSQINVNSYSSAAMERIALIIDPYWNDFGQYQFEVFDSRGGYLKRKSDKTPLFFRDKNKVKVKMIRKGALLTIYFNDTKMIEESVLNENVRWNFFGFGLGNAPNAEKTDEFYLTNIRLIK
jgi:hypothetical protein